MKYSKIILGLAIASFLILPVIGLIQPNAMIASAAKFVCPPDAVCIEPPTKHEKFEEFIADIAKWLFNIALVVAPIMFVIGGFYYITAQGDPAKIKKAGDLITWTAIGLILIMLTTGIIQLLKDMIE